MKIDLCEDLCVILREYIKDELEGFIADTRFTSHVTIFKENNMTNEARHQFAESLEHFKTGSMVATAVTMRAKKDKLRNIGSESILDISLTNE